MGECAIPPSADCSRGLKTYHRKYLDRVTRTLKKNFPVLLKWLGDESFESLVKPYLMEYPSHHRCLDEVGRNFPDFLQGLIQPGDPKFLPDLARAEWAKYCAEVTLTDVDTAAPPFPDLEDPASDSFRFTLNPSAELFLSEWPVDRLLKHQPSIVFRQTVRLAIYLGKSHIQLDRLRSRQWELLQLIQCGSTLAAIGRWLKSERIKPAQYQKWISHWLECGLIQVSTQPLAQKR